MIRRCNEEAETAVLGAMILDNELMAMYGDRLAAEDFYDVRNGLCWMAMQACSERGEPIDAVTMVRELRSKNRLQAAGGMQYLGDLTANVPSISGAEKWVAIVQECSEIRKVAKKAERLLEACRDEKFGLSSIQAQVADISIDDRGKNDLTSMTVLAEQWMQQFEIGMQQGPGLPGVSTGIEELDEYIGGLKAEQFIVVGARPRVGKTLMSGQVAVSVAKQGQPVLFVSLEMPQLEIFGRMVCAQARVPSDAIRFRRLENGQMQAIETAVTQLAELPIWMLDSSGTTVAGVRSAVARVKARYGLCGVILDYIQILDHDSRREEKRAEAITRDCRELKRIARDYKCWVMGLAQINRAAEDTDTKKPELRHLKECVTGDTMVLDPCTGLSTPIRDLVNGKPSSCLGVDSDLRMKVSNIESAWSSGIRPVYRVTTMTGRSIKATSNHPFLTVDGWKALEQLKVGDRVGVARSLPEPASSVDGITLDQARMLGYLIADGCYLRHCSVSYVKADDVCCDDVIAIAHQFGIEPKEIRKGKARQISLTMTGMGRRENALIEWLRSVGIHGQKGDEKVVPDVVMMASNAIVSSFIGALWAGDGTVCVRGDHRAWLKYSTVSHRLALQVQELLARLGICCHIPRPTIKGRRRPLYSVMIEERNALMMFAERIKMPGVKQRKSEEAARVASSREDNARIDRLPVSVTQRLADSMKRSGASYKQAGYRPQGKQITPSDLARVGAIVNDPSLLRLALSDVLWDGVRSIEALGEQEVFDLRAPETSCFLANGIFVHNSGGIEQYADVVLLLHRPELYEENSPDRGIVEIDVAKQRGGRTGTIRLQFEGEYSTYRSLNQDVGGPVDDAPLPPDPEDRNSFRDV